MRKLRFNIFSASLIICLCLLPSASHNPLKTIPRSIFNCRVQFTISLPTFIYLKFKFQKGRNCTEASKISRVNCGGEKFFLALFLPKMTSSAEAIVEKHQPENDITGKNYKITDKVEGNACDQATSIKNQCFAIASDDK